MSVTKKQQAVADELVRYYEEEWAGFGLGTKIDALVKKNKFAYIIGVMLDGGNVQADQAWSGMLALRQRLKKQGVAFTPQAVAALDLEVLKEIASEKPCISKYHQRGSEYIHLAAQKIVDEYEGDADAVFDAFTAREVFYRLLDFKGIGDKKANMAMRLLIDELDDEDRYCEVTIDLPVDVQVVKVFTRTGLIGEGAGRAEIQRKAVELSPDAPWKLDSAWNIGHTWCTAKVAWCSGNPDAEDDSVEKCPIKKVCPKIGV